MTDRLFENNTLLKILSVVVAIFIWFQAQPQTRLLNLPIKNVAVTYGYINPHLTILSVSPSTVGVTINGDAATIDQSTVATNVSASVNVSHITKAGTYLLKVSGSNLPAGVTFVSSNPPRVLVTIGRMGQRKVPVTINVVGQPPAGVELLKYQPNQSRVTVSGPSNALQQVAAVVGSLQVGGRASTFTASVVLHAVDAGGKAVPKVQVNPPTARVTATIHPKPPEKVLPVIGQVTGTPAPGYTISQITVYPSSVTLTGKKSLLSSLNHIYTKPIDVRHATASITKVEPVVLPKGTSLIGSGTVTVTVTITHAG